MGKWDKGEDEKHIYKDGIPPWEWTGSVPILSRYMQNGGKYVKYGQCWVFSGLSTTSKSFKPVTFSFQILFLLLYFLKISAHYELRSPIPILTP